MSEVNEVVAAIIREHPQVPEDEAWDECLSCSHLGDYASHVASLILAALSVQGYTLVRPITPEEEATNVW